MLLNLSGLSIINFQDGLIREELSRLNLNHEDIEELNVSNCGLTTLEGLCLFKNLHTLTASHNDISVIDPISSLHTLRSVKLDHNCLTGIYVKHNTDGKTVLSSLPDSLNLPIKDLIPQEKGVTVGSSNVRVCEPSAEGYDYIDLSFNKIDCITGQKHCLLKCSTLILSNNLISVFDGLCSFFDTQILDLSFNVECDVEKLLECAFAPNCKIFLQSTKLLNAELLTNLLNEYGNATAYTDLGDIHHERLFNVCNLDLAKLKEKRFTSTPPGYADFIYDGDEFPLELLTPRYDIHTKSDKAHIHRSLDILEPFETGSTIDTNEHCKSFSCLEHDSRLGLRKTSPGDYKPTKHLPDIAIPNAAHLDFLYSSVRLCNTIDSWTSDIKNTLLENLDE